MEHQSPSQREYRHSHRELLQSTMAETRTYLLTRPDLLDSSQTDSGSSDSTPLRHLAIVFFDVLMLNGKSLVQGQFVWHCIPQRICAEATDETEP